MRDFILRRLLPIPRPESARGRFRAALIAALAFLFTPAAFAADYTITSGNNAYTITNTSNNADVLIVSQPTAGTIAFAAKARTFSVNNGTATTNNSANLTLSNITSITINGGVVVTVPVFPVKRAVSAPVLGHVRGRPPPGQKGLVRSQFPVPPGGKFTEGVQVYVVACASTP